MARFRIPLKIQSRWCINHPNWWRSYFSISDIVMWLKHKCGHIWCCRPNCKFLIRQSMVYNTFYLGKNFYHPKWGCPYGLSVLASYGIVEAHGYRNHLKIAIRMMYRSSYWGKVHFHPNFRAITWCLVLAFYGLGYADHDIQIPSSRSGPMKDSG